MHRSVFFQEIRFSFDGKERLETFTKCCCCFHVAVAIVNVVTVIVVAKAIFIALAAFIFKTRLLE